MKNVKIILFLILSCVETMAVAQSDEAYVDQLTAQFTKHLTDKGVPSFLISKQYCSGAVEMFMIDGKMCTSKGTYYEVFVLWKEGMITYLKKIDNCGLFRTVKLPSNELFDMAMTDFDSIQNEEVKKYKSEIYTGVPESRKKVQPCGITYTLQRNGKRLLKSFNLFDISNDSSGKNLNYEFNMGLRLITLNTKITELVSMLEARRQ